MYKSKKEKVTSEVLDSYFLSEGLVMYQAPKKDKSKENGSQLKKKMIPY